MKDTNTESARIKPRKNTKQQRRNIYKGGEVSTSVNEDHLDFMFLSQPR